MARRVLLKTGERLLSAKLEILNGSGSRRPSIALSILTGRVDQLSIPADRFVAHSSRPVARSLTVVQPTRPRLLPRTVYLTESHLRDIEAIIDAWQPVESRRLTRSAVVRRALEHLRVAVAADPATSLLESKEPCPRS